MGLNLHKKALSAHRSLVGVTGEVDMASASGLSAAIAEVFSDGRHAVIDLTAVDFLDTSGLGAVLAARRRAVELGLELTVVAPAGSAARRILDMTEVTNSLSVVDSLDTAVSD